MTQDNHQEKHDGPNTHDGVETTGHKWDGIEELNNPTPRWWLMVFFITCLWAFGYWYVYPAWPTLSGEGVRGGTEGSESWTSYGELSDSQAEIRARRAAYQDAFDKASFADIQQDPALYAFAIAGGKSAFKDNCATCHGTGGAGAEGYPNLNDDDWLWGGSVTAIQESIAHGIRADNDDTRVSDMPAFKDILSLAESGAVADHVLSLTGQGSSSQASATLYADNCAMCHGDAGKGMRDLGAPNLADAIWFYGDSKTEIVAQIRAPRHGVMPAWQGRLDESTIRQLTLYVHSLGGGE